MKLSIMPEKVERMTIPDADSHGAVLQFLEKIGRVCYKSEKKITANSAKEFVTKRREQKHLAMLEHYIFVMEVPKIIYKSLLRIQKIAHDRYPELTDKFHFIHMSRCTVMNDGCSFITRWLVSGSATAFQYLWDSIYQLYQYHLTADECLSYNYASAVLWKLFQTYPELICSPDQVYSVPYILNSLMSSITFLTRKEIEQLPVNQRMIHDSMTVWYFVNRGVTHELVRHRPCSWAQESTRYCNYGKKGYTVILPKWLPSNDWQLLMDLEDTEEIYTLPGGISPVTKIWLDSIQYAVESYDTLLNEFKEVPQHARGVLPNDIKSEIVQTCTMAEWIHFFKMRIPASAHPQMREITTPLFDEVTKKYPEIFQDLHNELIPKNEG